MLGADWDAGTIGAGTALETGGVCGVCCVAEAGFNEVCCGCASVAFEGSCGAAGVGAGTFESVVVCVPEDRASSVVF